MGKPLSKQFYDALLTAPEKVIEDFNLIYVNAQDMNILRLRSDDTFHYRLKNRVLTKTSELDRINHYGLEIHSFLKE